MLRTLCYDILESITGQKGVRIPIGIENNPEFFVVPLRWRRWFGKNYETQTFEFIARYCAPGMTFVDIGAHFGIVSLAAARRVGPRGRVYSFEPCSATRTTMQEFLRLNPVDALIEVRKEAVHETPGVQTMYFSEIPGDVANTLVGNQKHQIQSQVKTTSLDEIAASLPTGIDCLKIDAEGAELAILRGGRKLFTEQRPKTHLSLHPAQINAGGGKLEELWDVVTNYGLKVYTLSHDEALRQWFCIQQELFEVVLLPR